MPDNNNLSTIKNVYFIGIGGVSMSSLALILKSLGKSVSGYDFKHSEITDMLEQNGVHIDYTASDADLSGCDTVVFTAAISEDDPVYKAAIAQNKRILSRAELLGMVTGGYRMSIGVAGTHGKSTTTGFLAQILLESDSDATILAGAALPALGGMYRVGGGDIAAFEACEYKNSYHHMHPTVKVVLNCELDHVDFFKNLDAVIDSFTTYLNIPGSGGVNIGVVNLDNKNAVKAAELSNADVRYFSIENKNADFYAQNIDISTGFAKFDLFSKEQGFLFKAELCVPGLHNVSNAVAAALAAHVCGIDIKAIQKGLCEFTGVKRRFERIGTLPCGALVIDDYAHHPDEIRATLSAAKKVAKGRVICVFQPHTYSRTKALLGNFASALSDCDKVICAKIYPAREKDIFNISSADLAELIPNAECMDSFSEIAAYIQNNAQPDDMIITMGAGDIYKVSDYLLFA